MVIRTTDKSKRLCISTYESYVRQGQIHTGTDREVGEEEIRAIQKRVTTTARALVKIFRVGEGIGGNNSERTMNAYSSSSCTVPPLSINPKDHKAREVNGDPKTRPICDGSQSMNCRLSDILCKILTPLLKEKSGELGDEVN